MKKSFLAVFTALFMLAAISEASSTKVVVRALAKDAKFIGASMGGALVIIRNSETGEILSKGLTSGGTGNTDVLMKTPIRRHSSVTDEKTAKFETTIDISEPVLATIEVSGPQGHKQASIKSSTQVWLIPGKDITGDGIVVEMPGFVVDVMAPQAHDDTNLNDTEASVQIKAKIVML